MHTNHRRETRYHVRRRDHKWRETNWYGYKSYARHAGNRQIRHHAKRLLRSWDVEEDWIFLKPDETNSNMWHWE